MLRKQLDESKVRQEEELRSRQELEQIVTGLQRELEERDQVKYFLENISTSTYITENIFQVISSLNISSLASSVLGSPFVMSPQQGSPGDSPPSGESQSPHCTRLLSCSSQNTDCLVFTARL